MTNYYQTSESGKFTAEGFYDITSADVADLMEQAKAAGLLPTIQTEDVIVFESGGMISAIVRADVFTVAAQKASAAGVKFIK